MPIESHKLLKDIVKVIKADTKVLKGWATGSCHMGLPCDPSKASTCCYMLIDLPCEKLDLGSLPRDDMITELDDNPLKMCKQRRDVTFPDGDKDSQFRFNMHLYGFCMSVQPPPLFLTLGSYVICNLCERHRIPASGLRFSLAGSNFLKDHIVEFKAKDELTRNFADNIFIPTVLPK